MKITITEITRLTDVLQKQFPKEERSKCERKAMNVIEMDPTLAKQLLGVSDEQASKLLEDATNQLVQSFKAIGLTDEEAKIAAEVE